MKDPKFDKEEKEILEAYERGEYVSVSDLEEEKKRLKKSARATLRKNKTVSIRLPERDVEKLKAKAAEKGMPYQTLIASVLHQYSSGASLVKDSERVDVT